MYKRYKAFTIMELLVVVAIIAVLAAIAVPNFMESCGRSPVSRAKAGMRSLATAIESYIVDNNVYPPPNAKLTVPHQLSTPTAYITNSSIKDPFTPKKGEEALLRYYRDSAGYHWVVTSVGPDKKPDLPLKKFVDSEALYFEIVNDESLSESEKEERKRDLYIFSADFLDAQYDPTNGTGSRGDIIRSGRGQLN